MWPTRKEKAEAIAAKLQQHSETRPMPGIAKLAAREALAWQMVSSVRRLEYTSLRKQRDISPKRADPRSDMFDPEAAAILHAKAGRTDEAIWLTFLATHFGKHRRHGWRLLRDVYSALGKQTWTWKRVSNDPSAFEKWIANNWDKCSGAFGNHRKYETLKPTPTGTGAIVASYVSWVGKGESHQKLFSELVVRGGNDPHKIFDEFYRSMDVLRFGRLGKFDFLALIGRLDLAPIEPGLAYVREATGPRAGSRLLFLGSQDDGSHDGELDEWVVELGTFLDLGMQVMEDSICNWQKSPNKFVRFAG